MFAYLVSPSDKERLAYAIGRPSWLSREPNRIHMRRFEVPVLLMDHRKRGLVVK